ncbi:hypothetical protein N0002_22160 [Pseudomonas aeruginosa]|nr:MULTISPECIES: hypothetical protein [Pseudomonas]ECA4546951.1 hypothetical protein [Salmonella enterica subsp. enterica serovar Typhimurium]HCL2592163.1 hypothetical protein [Pseudomonas aeruginosa C40A]EKU0636557.1 hypothetical protein [Pseudomonas aeruginosa]EKV4734553.1 hypothetical protein [Pseudomonas aeruginosa]EKX0335722.1 hypothetical protein [Pseudomonas aeruginosa]
MSIGFLERSRIERSVLKIVNDKAGSPHLNGLSGKALSQWMVGKHTAFSQLEKSRAAPLLDEISQRLRLNSDASKHIFEGEKLVTNGTTDICISELRKILS